MGLNIVGLSRWDFQFFSHFLTYILIDISCVFTIFNWTCGNFQCQLSKEVEDIHRTIKQSVASEVGDMQWQATRLEAQVMGIIEDRLNGYGDVSTALETRIQNAIERQTKELDLRMKTSEDSLNAKLERKFLQHERLAQDTDSEALQAVCCMVKGIDSDLREKVRLLEMKMLHDQPLVVAELVKSSLPKTVATNVDVSKQLQRADQTTSRIAQDVISKMATFKQELNQRIDLHMEHVDKTIKEFIDKNEKTQTSVKNMDRGLSLHLQDLRRELAEKRDLNFSTHQTFIEDARLRADVNELYERLNTVSRPKKVKKKRCLVVAKRKKKKKKTKKISLKKLRKRRKRAAF